MQLATFELGDESFAVPALQVEEFFRAIPVTQVWGADRRVDGLVNIRGRTAAVINMRACFGLPHRELCSEMMLLETRSGLVEEAVKLGLFAFEEPIVLSVDSVSQIHILDHEKLHPAPAHIKQQFVDGVVQSTSNYFTMISIEKLVRELINQIEEDQ